MFDQQQRVVVYVATAILLALTARCPGPNATAGQIHGRLGEYQGLPVLELWGTPEQIGYAHGYLLAEPIVHLMEDYVLSERVLPQLALYETVLVPAVRRQFVWDQRYERELRALCEGIRDRRGPA